MTGAVGGCVSKVSHLEPVYRVPHTQIKNGLKAISLHSPLFKQLTLAQADGAVVTGG